jgi:hypothetical protein
MGGLYTPQDILTAIAIGKMQSFIEGDSWMITQVAEFPRAKVVEVIALVGDLDECLAMHPRLLAFAEEIGASVIQAYGRKGWLAEGVKRGWKVKARSFLYQHEM